MPVDGSTVYTRAVPDVLVASIRFHGKVDAIGEAFRRGIGVEEVRRITGIDPWFLDQVEGLVLQEKRIVGEARQIGNSHPSMTGHLCDLPVPLKAGATDHHRQAGIEKRGSR